MILFFAVAAGFLAGLIRAKKEQTLWQTPELKYLWLVPIFFLPQLMAFYLPGIRNQMSDSLVSICLVSSQLGLIIFCLLNRQLPGMPVLTLGLFFNLIAIITNRGFMPISTLTAANLVPAQALANLEIGSRFGVGKDILLLREMIVFPWLADQFVPPHWFPYQFAFSLGDIFIGVGAFLLLASSPKSISTLTKGSFRDVNQSNI
jgi:hypothetical protein